MKGRSRVRRDAGIQRPVRVGEAAGSATRRASLGSPEAQQPLTAPDGAAHPQDRRSSALGRELAAGIRHNNKKGRKQCL